MRPPVGTHQSNAGQFSEANRRVTHRSAIRGVERRYGEFAIYRASSISVALFFFFVDGLHAEGCLQHFVPIHLLDGSRASQLPPP